MRRHRARGQLWAFVYLVVRHLLGFGLLFFRTEQSKEVVLNEAHLERILRSYAGHYNGHRPHQGLSQEIPALERTVPLLLIPTSGSQHGHLQHRPGGICRHDRLGGLIHEYELAACSLQLAACSLQLAACS
jgi:hypothetical protein